MIDAIREMKQKYAQKLGRGDHLSVIFWCSTGSIFSNRSCRCLLSIISYILAPSFRLSFLLSSTLLFFVLLYISFASSALCHILLPLEEFIMGNRVSDFSHLFPKQYSAEFALSKPDNNYFVTHLLLHVESMNICLYFGKFELFCNYVTDSRSQSKRSPHYVGTAYSFPSCHTKYFSMCKLMHKNHRG